MAGFGAYMAAGAAAGAGQSMIDQAKAARERALDTLSHKRSLERDRISHERTLERDTIRRQRDRADAERERESSRAHGREVGEFFADLTGTESGGNSGVINDEGYAGWQQFGQARLDDFTSAHGIGRITPEQFSQDEDLQSQVEAWHHSDNQAFIEENDLDSYVGETIGGVEITPSGMLAMAHLGGQDGLRQFLESGGEYNPADSNGTRLSDYAQTHGGKPIDWARYGEILGDPLTTAGQRDLATSAVEQAGGFGVSGGSADLSNMVWHDNGDGTETRMGYDGRQYVAIPGPDGEPLTRPTGGRDGDGDVTASGALSVRVARHIGDQSGLGQDAAESGDVDAIVEEIERRANGDRDRSIDEIEAEVLAEAQFDEAGRFTGQFHPPDPQPASAAGGGAGRETTQPTPGEGFAFGLNTITGAVNNAGIALADRLGFGASSDTSQPAPSGPPARPDAGGGSGGGGNAGDRPPLPPTPAPPPPGPSLAPSRDEPAAEGEQASAAPRGDRNEVILQARRAVNEGADAEQVRQRLESQGIDPETLDAPLDPAVERHAISQARDAIARGADRAAVVARLQAMGIDPRSI